MQEEPLLNYRNNSYSYFTLISLDVFKVEEVEQTALGQEIFSVSYIATSPSLSMLKNTQEYRDQQSVSSSRSQAPWGQKQQFIHFEFTSHNMVSSLEEELNKRTEIK